ncbi:potassium transporter, partial [Escherichia coli]|nr:potassium transporter [Escherichia coli]
RKKLLGLGGLQIVLTTAGVMLGGLYLGLPWQTALAVGLILALSSTAIVMQTLREKDLTRTEGGRSTFAVLLTQDIAVIPMLALMPLLAIAQGPTLAPDGSLSRPSQATDAAHESAVSLVAHLPAWGVTLATLTAVAVVVLISRFAMPPLFRLLPATRLHEMFTVVALLIVVGIAILMIMVGLSPALGTFLAGVVLANSEFRHELESNIEPFKGLLLGLFFMTVGAGINFHLLFARPIDIMGLTFAMMVVK